MLVLSSSEAERLEKTFASESFKNGLLITQKTSGGSLWNKTKTERSEGVTFNLSDCSGWQGRML